MNHVLPDIIYPANHESKYCCNLCSILMAIFPGELVLADVTGAKNDGSSGIITYGPHMLLYHCFHRSSGGVGCF